MHLESLKSNSFSTGLAMFSMFFGAGNVVFPLALGQETGYMNHYAILGLLITAVLVPFLGLISMTVYDGNYRLFFGRLGRWPGLLLAGTILALIGPFGAIPRCITLAYSTSKLFLPLPPLWIFALASCLLIFFLSFRRRRILDILGYALTPLLIILLSWIIIQGVWSGSYLAITDSNAWGAFQEGFHYGYQTMDLLGAFFFSSVVLVCLKQELDPEGTYPSYHLVGTALKASLLGASLLGIFYVGLSYVTAYHAELLQNVAPQDLIGTVSLQVLGPYAGLVASGAVALACLTTAMALSAVFAQFVHEDLTFGKLTFPSSLVITLLVSLLVSLLNFEKIVQFLTPLLEVCYPSMIVLAALNLLYKLTGFSWVKLPVLAVFICTLIFYTVGLT